MPSIPYLANHDGSGIFSGYAGVRRTQRLVTPKLRVWVLRDVFLVLENGRSARDCRHDRDSRWYFLVPRINRPTKVRYDCCERFPVSSNETNRLDHCHARFPECWPCDCWDRIQDMVRDGTRDQRLHGTRSQVLLGRRGDARAAAQHCRVENDRTAHLEFGTSVARGRGQLCSQRDCDWIPLEVCNQNATVDSERHGLPRHPPGPPIHR